MYPFLPSRFDSVIIFFFVFGGNVQKNVACLYSLNQYYGNIKKITNILYVHAKNVNVISRRQL